MSDVQLTQDEKVAIALLRNTPEEIQKLARPDGTINLDDVHSYFYNLSRRLEFIRSRKKKEYIDVDKKENS